MYNALQNLVSSYFNGLDESLGSFLKGPVPFYAFIAKNVEKNV